MKKKHKHDYFRTMKYILYDDPIRKFFHTGYWANIRECKCGFWYFIVI